MTTDERGHDTHPVIARSRRRRSNLGGGGRLPRPDRIGTRNDIGGVGEDKHRLVATLSAQGCAIGNYRGQMSSKAQSASDKHEWFWHSGI